MHSEPSTSTIHPTCVLRHLHLALLLVHSSYARCGGGRMRRPLLSPPQPQSCRCAVLHQRRRATSSTTSSDPWSQTFKRTGPLTFETSHAFFISYVINTAVAPDQRIRSDASRHGHTTRRDATSGMRDSMPPRRARSTRISSGITAAPCSSTLCAVRSCLA